MAQTTESSKWAVEVRNIPAVIYSGRNGRKSAHIVLVDSKGRRVADTQITKFTDVEAVKARYQRIADNYNA